MKKVLFVLSWIPFLLIKAALAIIGLVFVPMLLWIDMDMQWMPVWGNREGCPDWWFTSCANGEENKIAEWFPRFWWYAIRNPVNNTRFWFEDTDDYHAETNWHSDAPMEAAQMQEAKQAMAYYWRWKGWKSGFRQVWLSDNTHYGEIWFGWKLGSGVPGLGFTSQVRLNRKIGT